MKFNIKLFDKPITYVLLGIIITFLLLEVRNKCFIKK